jgi:uncharacterized protein YjbI with pentapeptide repeats
MLSGTDFRDADFRDADFHGFTRIKNIKNIRVNPCGSVSRNLATATGRGHVGDTDFRDADFHGFTRIKNIKKYPCESVRIRVP